MKVGLVQMCSGRDLDRNLANCERFAREAADRGADWIIFPENAPFLGKDPEKVEVAQPIDGSITDTFARLAIETESWITVGSFPEVSPDDSKTYNTQVHIAPNGDIVDVYRKLHLFDVDIKDGGAYCESDSIKKGDQTVTTTVESEHEWKVGLSICYDLRFPLLYRALFDEGAQILTVPSAFTRETGQFHWHGLLKARAIENQSYVLAPNQWGHHFGSRYSFGQSVVYDPWGQQIASASDETGIVTAHIDRDYFEDVRGQIPTSEHRVFDAELSGLSE